jgi:hypothetical protein
MLTLLRPLNFLIMDDGTNKCMQGKIKSILGLVFMYRVLGFFWRTDLIRGRTARQDQARPDADPAQIS